MTATPETTAKPAKKETVVETVTMLDGRVVEFPGKRKLLKTSTGNQTRLDFRNGETRLFTIPEAMLTRFATHGAEQKLGDECAGLEDVDDMVLAVDEMIDRLYGGEWNVKREANGLAGTSVLARALCEVYGKPAEYIKAFLAKKSQADKIALRNSSKIKPVVERIEAEKASKGKKVDEAALFAGLEDATSETPAE